MAIGTQQPRRASRPAASPGSLPQSRKRALLFRNTPAGPAAIQKQTSKSPRPKAQAPQGSCLSMNLQPGSPSQRKRHASRPSDRSSQRRSMCCCRAVAVFASSSAAAVLYRTCTKLCQELRFARLCLSADGAFSDFVQTVLPGGTGRGSVLDDSTAQALAVSALAKERFRAVVVPPASSPTALPPITQKYLSESQQAVPTAKAQGDRFETGRSGW
ncbi:hypothetical protein BDV96DRAFT_646176 [Lophiotrema nucula]|uniref:Uncharacterized protein n=1 Tax=Lophiotrema nucula TaxID=690887 RepID=A0A6A5Z791_9PLEO|nr:hypothetical protein BDV96DRAFT_646176 [Lophiotrema nucula]